MGKGFAPVLPTGNKAQLKPELPLTSINEIQASLLTYLQDIPDPRVSRTQKHLLTDILVIAILAVIAGAEGWEDMENYGLSKQSWLSEFLELPNGIPSDDTFRRVFERINPFALSKVLSQWLPHLIGSLSGEIVPIDGKSLRGSYDRNQGIKALHLPAFLTKKENGVSESPTQYRFEPDFSPAPPTTVCCENLTRHRHELDLRKKELICVKFTQIN